MDLRAKNRAEELYKDQDNQLKSIKDYKTFAFKQVELQVTFHPPTTLFFGLNDHFSTNR